jgi:2'-5' RNA ligase
VRLFLSIPIPDKLAQSLVQVQASLESSHWSLKVTAPEKFHVTLHFLGETQESLLADLHHDLGACAHRLRPFDLKVGGLGAFPNFDDPRVLWMGVQDQALKLRELFDATRRVLDPYRLFRLEETLKQAHVTLARVEALKPGWATVRLSAVIAQWQSLGRLPVEELHLMRSQQGRYELVEKFILGG